MAKVEVVKIGHGSFLKDSAKDMTFAQFEKSYSHKNYDYLDKEKAYVLLGGKKPVKKKEDDK